MSAVCKHHIPTVGALRAVLGENDRQERWQEYVADMSCLMVKRLSRKFDVPLYSTMNRRTPARKDSRSGQEIVDDVIAKWRRRRADRGEKN